MIFRVTPFLILTLFSLWGCNRPPKILLDQVNEKALPPVSATASVDKALISTEDIVTFQVFVSREKTIELNLPDIGSRISGFRVVDFGTEEKDEEGTRKSLRKWYSLRADVSGSYVLPEVEIPYTEAGQPKSIKTSEIFVEVKSPATMAEAAPTDDTLRDIKDIEKTPLNLWFWVIAIIVVGSAVAGIFFWKQRKKYQLQIPKLAPHELALQKLDGLTVPNGGEPSHLKRFYFELSEIIRVYAEANFFFRATDMTSEEIVRYLKNNSALPDSEKPLFIELLKETDVVKFTDFRPSLEAASEARDRAKRFVFNTKQAEPTQKTEPVV